MAKTGNAAPKEPEVVDPSTVPAVRENESTTIAVAAERERARAMLETRMTMARQCPRDMNQARDELLRECREPAFAETGWYSRPVGGGQKAEGPSIRLLEAAARACGHIDTRSEVLSDEPMRRVVRVTALDFAKLTSYSADIDLHKVVERKRLKPGDVPISKRQNSSGDWVYLIPADELSLRTRQLAEESKAIRKLLERLIPSWLLAEAVAECKKAAKKKEDPRKAQKALADAFSELGVQPAELAEWLGCKLEAASPAQLDDLRGVFTLVKDGEATWADVLAKRRAERSAAEAGTQARAEELTK